MESRILGRFRQALEVRRQQLLDWISEPDESSAIHLCGCSITDVGVVGELNAALEEIDHGGFGHCERCGGEVEIDRLQLDFTTRVCLECYSEEQITALERDLEVAAAVQRQLFPTVVPAMQSCEIAAHVRPAHVVGGDYYDFFRYADNSQGLALADVMGKGLSASMLMSSLQASLRILGPEYSEPDGLAVRLNEMFLHNVSVGRFISMFFVKLASDESEIHYCNAGHLPGLLLSTRSGRISTLPPTGPAIGLVPTPPYRTERHVFEPGDVLLLYTDGVVEARDQTGTEFGEQRLRAQLEEHRSGRAGRLVAAIRESVETFSGGVVRDDLSLLALKRSA